MKLVIPLTLLCYIASVAATDSLCSSDIFDNKCLCQSHTNEETTLPMTVATCYGLNFSTFPNVSQFPNDITELDLSINTILSLQKTDINSLQKLILSYNDISHISVDFLEGFPNLKHLDLSHNSLTTLLNMFTSNSKLTYLDLSYNNFKDLPSTIFYHFPVLQYLDLSYNPLGDFLMKSENLQKTLGLPANISLLKLNHMGMTDSLSQNFLRDFNNLTYLELKDNKLSNIPTVPYSLEHLDLSGNNLTFVSARYLNYHSLRYLRLSRMSSLESIHHYAFYNLQSLETLVITDCPNLREFTDLAFGLASKTMTIHPTSLILARNGIPALNETYAHMFRNMKHIDLRHNPWDCSCEILWLQEFAEELYRGNELRCAAPDPLRRKQLISLTHLDMPDCFPEIYGKTSHRITIVVLMSVVLFLIGLIFYLIRYPKTWVSPRQIGIGPNSPYSPAPQEDVRF